MPRLLRAVAWNIARVSSIIVLALAWELFARSGAVTPFMLPQEQWSPSLQILNSKEVFAFRDGEIQVPELPGLGLDINEDALEHYRVRPT